METSCTLTAADLLDYAKKQARIEARDYFDSRYARPDEIRAWQTNRRRRDVMRRKVLRTYPGRCRSAAPLTPGRYYGTRLIITADTIEYIPGQYAPVEIWAAVLDYFDQTNLT